MPKLYHSGQNKNQPKSRKPRKQSTIKADATTPPSQRAPGDKDNEEPAPNRGNNRRKEPINGAQNDQYRAKDVSAIMEMLTAPSQYHQTPGQNTTDVGANVSGSKPRATGKEPTSGPKKKKKSTKSSSATDPEIKRKPRKEEMNKPDQQRKDQQPPMASDKGTSPRNKKDSDAKADDLAFGPQSNRPEPAFATPESGDDCKQSV